MHTRMGLALALSFGVMCAAPAQGRAEAPDGLPAAIEAPGKVAILRLHAEGAQIYSCQADGAGALRWAFREPIATLLVDGKTVGHHKAGPIWELDAGGALMGKVLTRAPAAGAGDIPWLKLEAMPLPQKGRRRRAPNLLQDARLIQRINTQGGALEGECPKMGALRSVAYSADYVFLGD